MVCRRVWPYLALLAALGLQSAGCATNPYTKRWQLLMIPQSYEANLGAQAYQDVLSDPQVKISQNPAEVAPVQRISARIIEAAKRSKYAEAANEFKWEVSVIKDDGTKNAFALPGGKIAVYTGIFPVADNESGLAAIVGHEVVHALARHGSERMSQGVLAQIGLVGASIAMQTQGFSPVTSQAAMAASSLPCAARMSPSITWAASLLGWVATACATWRCASVRSSLGWAASAPRPLRRARSRR